MSWCHEGRIIIVYYTSGCDVEKKEIGVGEVRFLMLSSFKIYVLQSHFENGIEFGGTCLYHC